MTGEVDNAFTAPVDELASENSVKQVMTCTCGGNPADGKAIITADVKGIPVSHLLDRAEARDGVNTVTFVSSDGTELAMPISYVVGRHGVLSYEINDEDLSASVGGNNQLWMTRTPANYFVRDVVEVRVTREEEPPANPGEDMTARRVAIQSREGATQHFHILLRRFRKSTEPAVSRRNRTVHPANKYRMSA